MSFGVNTFLTVTANVSVSLDIIDTPESSESQPIIATFDPNTFEAFANENATTLMTLTVTSDAPLGVYSTVLRVTDVQNSSLYWGTPIQLVVQ